MVSDNPKYVPEKLITQLWYLTTTWVIEESLYKA